VPGGLVKAFEDALMDRSRPSFGWASVLAGPSMCQAKKTIRLTMTPHQRGGNAAERRGDLRSPWVASTSGAPQRMNRNDGRKVKK
jgi:hypothetical protein